MVGLRLPVRGAGFDASALPGFVLAVLPMLEGKTASPYEGASHVGYEMFGLKAYFAGDWKILRMSEPFGTGDWELFNLKEDPAEMIDLSKEHPGKVEEMVALWEQYREDNGVLDISYDLSGME